MNYGETLAYWYLRLNGFFPLTNFVLHSGETSVEHSADCDILAVRFPYVSESMGDVPFEWDRRLTNWGLEPQGRIIGLIVEVKSGASQVSEGATRAFRKARLEYAIRRLGFFPDDAIEMAVNELARDTKYVNEDKVVAKLLITAEASNHDSPPWLKLSLGDANEFITNRMSDFADGKFRDRMFFPSDLLQYIIWNERRSS